MNPLLMALLQIMQGSGGLSSMMGQGASARPQFTNTLQGLQPGMPLFDRGGYGTGNFLAGNIFDMPSPIVQSLMPMPQANVTSAMRGQAAARPNDPTAQIGYSPLGLSDPSQIGLPQSPFDTELMYNPFTHEYENTMGDPSQASFFNQAQPMSAPWDPGMILTGGWY